MSKIAVEDFTNRMTGTHASPVMSLVKVAVKAEVLINATAVQ